MASIYPSDLVLYVVKIIPSLKNIPLTGVRDLINGVSIDERRGIQFRETQVIRVFSAYWRFDAAFSTLTVEPGVGGLSFYPEMPLQHTSSFCKTFSVLSRYVCMNVSS